MFTNKDFLIGLLAGVVTGITGYKLYQDHKEAILESLGKISNRCQGSCNEAQEQEISLEELEKQKEHLEDLIAETKSKAEAK